MLVKKEVQLYEIQGYIVDACRQAMKYNKRLILRAATGLGKTIIAAWMIKKAYRKDLKILFICDRVSLVDQTSRVFDEYGILHGIFQAENPLYAPDLSVQIGSIQTLARRKQRDYDFIIIDEAHTLYESHKEIIAHNKDAFVIGLSATPFSKGLGKYFDKHIEPVPMRQLIDQGYLSGFEIYGPAQIDLSGVHTVAGEYKQDELGEAADKKDLVADIVRTWKRLGRNKKTICFCVNVAHGRHLERVFKKSGINAKEINGYMQKEGEDGADQIIKDFREGKFKIIISTDMLVKGFDVTDVECIIFATATKSHIKFIQACGRGLRAHPGKKMCRILDHGSNTERLGFPDEYEILELDDGKKTKSKTKKQKPEKLPKKCPSCDFLKPGGVRTCPACGFTPEYIKDVAVEEGELKKLQRKKRKEFTLQDKQDHLALLNAFANSKGFRVSGKGVYGWSIHQFKEKFGCIPSNKINWSKVEYDQEKVDKFTTHQNIRYAKRRK